MRELEKEKKDEREETPWDHCSPGFCFCFFFFFAFLNVLVFVLTFAFQFFNQSCFESLALLRRRSNMFINLLCYPLPLQFTTALPSHYGCVLYTQYLPLHYIISPQLALPL